MTIKEKIKVIIKRQVVFSLGFIYIETGRKRLLSFVVVVFFVGVLCVFLFVCFLVGGRDEWSLNGVVYLLRFLSYYKTTPQCLELFRAQELCES